MKLKSVIFTSLSMLLFLFSTNNALFAQNKSKNYTTLVELFTQWRIFEQPPLLNGAPDYTVASFNRRQPNFIQLRKKLLSIDTVGWSIKEKVDWRIIWAEMNGYDFNVRILKPWQRDPAFYKSIYTERSDVPAHEGPSHHMVTDVWKYNFPLTANDRKAFMSSLKGIAALNNQAKINLTGNAKELWIAGIRDIRTQSDDLAEIMTKPGCATDKELTQLLKEGIASTNDLVQWLEKQSVKKTGASGIGKENYNWYQKNVHLVPLTWDDQVLLLKREL